MVSGSLRAIGIRIRVPVLPFLRGPFDFEPVWRLEYCDR
jgi:hypothetical protein